MVVIVNTAVLKMFVKEENGEESVVTVRLYGPNTDYIINRERELQVGSIFAVTVTRLLTTYYVQAIKYLSTAGFGAKLLGVFGNGMVQSFINARTLTPVYMRVPKLAAKIAKELCRFHAVEIPGSKEPQLWNEIFNFYESDMRVPKLAAEIAKELPRFHAVEIPRSKEPQLWNEIFKFYESGILVKKNKDHIFMHYLQLDKPDEVSSKELEVLYIESNAFMLASHIVWALWALIQATMPPINFDYLGYFFLCYNKYISKKETNCLLALAYLSGLHKA
ncbi:unnamed protein product [Linum tenue]|uniref:ethanolamine kinase n=1 Tax=Linum tenue TaxID=586396 RepID=A0AAV0LAH9_9ROSI|nr:unnamed protein product [Linum tenue]